MNLKKNILLLIFSVFVFYCAEAQKNKEVQAINFKNNAIIEIEKENYTKALQNITEALKITKDIENQEIKASCRLVAGDIYSKQNNIELSLLNYLRAASLLETGENKNITSQTYLKIAQIYYKIDFYEKASEYFRLSHNNNPNKKNIEQKLFLNKSLGNSFFYSNKYNYASEYYTKAKEYAEQLKDTNSLIYITIQLISIAKNQKEYKKSIVLNYEIYNIYTEQKNKNGIALIMNNIACDYVFMKEYQKAMILFEETLQNADSSNIDLIASTHTNIGICYNNNNNLEEAIDNLKTARDLWINNHQKKAETENIIALIYLKNNDLYNATLFIEDAILSAKKSNNPETKKKCYDTYSMILQAGHDYERAFDYHRKYMKINDSLLFEQRLKNDKKSRKIKELEKSEKELKLKIADELVKELQIKQQKLLIEQIRLEAEKLNQQKELEKSEKKRALQSLKLAKQKLEAEKKRREIAALENEKEIQNLKIKENEAKEKQKQKEIELLESKNEKNKLKIQNQKEKERRFLWTLGLGAIIFILVLFVLIMTRKKNKKLKIQKLQIEQKNEELNQQNEEILAQKDEIAEINSELNQQNEEITAQKEFLQKANEQITIQNVEIERKNEEITDSIKYAQRIQTAILSPVAILSSALSDSFILYLPKDIVSGDFYWIKKINNIIVIAVADCTGHGVPGAFMSMLGISYLNEIVTKTRFDNADKILNRLRNKVKKSLRQTGKKFEQKDGMDMALLIINKDNMKLQYAGANNPLIMIRNKEMTVTKADKMPIGIHHREKPFTNHIIEIQNDDIFYVYSDGYQDQFGGEKGRKFLSKRFKNLLLENHKLPMEKQKEILHQQFEEWKSTVSRSGEIFQQIDDILVAGIKI